MVLRACGHAAIGSEMQRVVARPVLGNVADDRWEPMRRIARSRHAWGTVLLSR